jgi:pyruvate dehydrogenase E2 component (dihydrolipoamide acetyltransferase)
MSDSSEFKLPDVGEGLTEAEIVTWYVRVGDTVKINDTLVDIETAKSVVELPSPFAGVVEQILVEPGTTVDVGTPIIVIGSGASQEATKVPPVPEADSVPGADPQAASA